MLTGPFSAPMERAAFAGAFGEVELRDKIKGRDIAIPYRVSASSVANVQSAVDSLHIQAGQLNGTLTIDSTTYQHCTFTGFMPEGRIFLDASSTNWFQRGVCVFRQLNYYA